MLENLFFFFSFFSAQQFLIQQPFHFSMRASSIFVFVTFLCVCSSIRVRDRAPDFEATGVIGPNNFKDFSLDSFKGRYLVLFFYPMDFTFVCPTEIIEFSNNVNKFEKLGASVVGVSIDSKFVHSAWMNAARSDGGIGQINFPLLDDKAKKIAEAYDTLIKEGGDEGVSLRSLFIIDPKQVIRHISTNDLPVGRNVDEVLRLVEAFKFSDENEGQVVPCGWKPGSATMAEDIDGSKEYFQEVYA